MFKSRLTGLRTLRLALVLSVGLGIPAAMGAAPNGVYMNGSGFAAFDGMYVWTGMFDASNPSHLVTFNSWGPISNGAFQIGWTEAPKTGTYTIRYYINANNSPMLQPVDPPTLDPCWVTTIGPGSYVKNVQLNAADIVDQCRSLPVPSRNNEPSALKGVSFNGSGFASFDGMYVWAGLFDVSNPSYPISMNAFGPITNGAFQSGRVAWSPFPRTGTYTIRYYINANNSPKGQPVDPPTLDPCWVTTIGPESYYEKNVQLNTGDIVDQCRSLPGPVYNNEPSALKGVSFNGSGFAAFNGMYVWAGLFDASNPSHLVTFNAFGPITNGAFQSGRVAWSPIPRTGTYTIRYYINANNSPKGQPVDPPTLDPCWVTTIGTESYYEKNVQLNTGDIVDQCRSLPGPVYNNPLS